jgi:hypothetical protein
MKATLQNLASGILCGLLISAPVVLSAFGLLRG